MTSVTCTRLTETALIKMPVMENEELTARSLVPNVLYIVGSQV